ncbi:MAG: TolC family protein [Acidobacteria bacterium]|nr:TolC family protein [Acidobacteriota bacterium]
MRRNRKWKALFLLAAAAALTAAATVAAQMPQRLTLKEAVDLGLRHNLRVLVAGTQVDEATGTRQRRLSALLPVARAESYANVQTRNLRASGIDVPGAPGLIGPFSSYDFRGYAEQPVLDLRAWHRWKAGGLNEAAARENYQDVRDLIVRQVAALYLNAQAAAARVEAAGSRVATAERLDQLARDQREAGVATGVDVLRAQVELANERQRLLEARNATDQALLSLKRAIGLELGAPVELAEPLDFKPVAPPDIAATLAAAVETRPDYRALETQHRALEREAKANRARYYPRLSVGGNYGALGRNLGDIRGTGLLQGTMTITLFDYDRRGERTELDSRQRRLQFQLDDLRQGIEQEIRDALLVLESAAQEVSVAEQGRTLAERELDLARERFQAGVTNNIEVISAQESLARAQENRILALARYSDAKAALARAVGATERNYEQYLGAAAGAPEGRKP